MKNFPFYTAYPKIRISHSLWLGDKVLFLAWGAILCLGCYFLCKRYDLWGRFDGKIGVVVCIVFANILFAPWVLWNVLGPKARMGIKSLSCRVSARLGSPLAQYELGSLALANTGYDRVSADAKRWLHKAAVCGNVFAMWKLARVYSINDAHVRDLKKAYDFLKGAANGGHVGAICALGCCLEDGSGVEKSLEDAAACYLAAAKYGLAPAQHNIGCCYAMGVGVGKDEAEAELWFSKADEQGYYINGRKTDEMEHNYAVIELWNLRLLFCQPQWNRQFSDDFLDNEINRVRRD